MPSAPKILPLKPKHTPRPRGKTTERGYGWDHQRQRARLIRQFPVCQRCDANWSAHLHHRDGDPFNRADSNCLMLCEPCHQREHAGG